MPKLPVNHPLRQHYSRMLDEHQADCKQNTEAYLKEVEKAGYTDLHEYEFDVAGKTMLTLAIIFIVFVVLVALNFIYFVTQ